MLPAAKNKVTISILERLRAKGPAPKSVDSGLMGAHDDDVGADDMGGDGSILKSSILPNPLLPKKPKKKLLAEADEEENE